MYDRIGQKAPCVIHVSIEPRIVYELSPKLQAAVSEENALKARLLLTLSQPEKLQIQSLVTRLCPGNRKHEKARQRKNY